MRTLLKRRMSWAADNLADSPAWLCACVWRRWALHYRQPLRLWCRARWSTTKGQPVEGAAIVIEQEGTNRHFDMKSNKKGEFMQIGLPSGSYKVTATKDQLTASQPVRVTQSRPLTRRSSCSVPPQRLPGENAQLTALRKVLDDALAASNAGRYDDAIAGFQKALGNTARRVLLVTTTSGYAYTQKNGLRQRAKPNYKKAIEQKARLRRCLLRGSPASTTRSASSICGGGRQRQGDRETGRRCRSALRLAGGGGGTPTRYSIRASCCGTAARSPMPKKAFESAIQANPNHAEAHYRSSGMALVNEGNLAGATQPEFETYREARPGRPNAAHRPRAWSRS